jgi:hypothetical protein
MLSDYKLVLDDVCNTADPFRIVLRGALSFEDHPNGCSNARTL